MLVEHRVDDMDKGLVGRNKAMASCKQMPFEHAFRRMFPQHFDSPAVTSKFSAVRIFGKVLRNPEFLTDRINIIQFVGSVFVWSEDAKVLHVQFHDIPQEHSQRTRVFGLNGPRFFKLQAVLLEVRKAQGPLKLSPVSVRIRAHPSRTRDRKSTRLNSSHGYISYAVFCLKKKKYPTKHSRLFVDI